MNKSFVRPVLTGGATYLCRFYKETYVSSRMKQWNIINGKSGRGVSYDLHTLRVYKYVPCFQSNRNML